MATSNSDRPLPVTPPSDPSLQSNPRSPTSRPTSPRLSRTIRHPIRIASDSKLPLHSTPRGPNPNPQDLLQLASGVVKNRNGSVLARGFILKSDWKPPRSIGAAAGQDVVGVQLRGASNFRSGGLGVYGVAQPTETGLRTILSVLESRNEAEGKMGRETVWFSTREEAVVYIGGQPFVLRDSSSPATSYSLSHRAENLEAVEQRLKEDIITEATYNNGLILVHEEVEESMIHTWISSDLVRTPKELWTEMTLEYNVLYHRIPVAKTQSPEDGILDQYYSILISTPTSSSLVFNCGLGVVRTSFAMSTALIVRRQQLLHEGKPDAYGIVKTRRASRIGDEDETAAAVIRASQEQATRDQSLLRLMNVLQKCTSPSLTLVMRNQYTNRSENRSG